MARQSMKDLIDMLNGMKQEMDDLKRENSLLRNNNPIRDDTNRKITVIHLDNLIPGLTTHIRGEQDWTFTSMGDSHRIPRSELDKIMSKAGVSGSAYKKFFTRGILTFSEKDSDMFEEYGITKPNTLSPQQYNDLKTLSIEDLKKIYSEVSPIHKESILRYFTEPDALKNPDYNKLYALNAVSGGYIQSIIDNLK